MKFAVTLGRMHPRIWAEAATLADQLGFDSVWLPEHLVLPVVMAGSPFAGDEHPPVPPTTQLFDAASMLSFLAARTTRVRLGTYVYLLGLRHPFISARAFATLDWLSGGRAVIGAGAGWLESEWRAAGVDPADRGDLFDEAIVVCRRLWSEETITHDGPHFAFEAVAFEPKPPQGSIPILVGGESARALRRAAWLGDGWIGMGHTPESAAAVIADLRAQREDARRIDQRFEVVVGGSCASEDDVTAWEDAGVDCLIVTPWNRTAEVFDTMATFAQRFLGTPGAQERAPVRP